MERSSRRPSVVGHLALGRAGYREVLELQRRLHARRRVGKIDDLVLTVEHDPVFTIGRTGSREHLLVDPERLDREGIDILDIERGGDITYHGPGQLVVYPILDLRARGLGVKDFVDRLEETAIRVLADCNIDAARRPGYPGVWVAETRADDARETRKIASIGVYVKGWVTMHGLALNVAVNAEHFAMINPCGLPVTAVSVAELVNPVPSLDVVRGRFLVRLGEVFGWELREIAREDVE